MNLKQEFNLRRLTNEILLLEAYLDHKDLIDRGGQEFQNWIEDLNHKVVFSKKNTIKYYNHIINMEKGDIKEIIEFKRNKIKGLKEQIIIEQNINLFEGY